MHSDILSLRLVVWLLFREPVTGTHNKVNTAKTPFISGYFGVLCVYFIPHLLLCFCFLPFQCSNNPFSWGPLDCFDINIQKDQREIKAQLVAFPFKAVTFRPCLCYRCLLAGLCQATFDGEFDPCQADLCEQMKFFWLCCLCLAGVGSEWAWLCSWCKGNFVSSKGIYLHMGDPVPAHAVVPRLSCAHGCSCAAQEAKQLSLQIDTALLAKTLKEM